jgi:hypothetical protein
MGELLFVNLGLPIMRLFSEITPLLDSREETWLIPIFIPDCVDISPDRRMRSVMKKLPVMTHKVLSMTLPHKLTE